MAPGQHGTTASGYSPIHEQQATFMRVQDKSIIVTGAGGGIGEGIARRLAQEIGRAHV